MPLNSTYVQFVYHIFTCMKSPSLILNVMVTGTVNNMLSRQAGRGSGGGWREEQRAGVSLITAYSQFQPYYFTIT